MPIQTLGDTGSIADSASNTAISDNTNTPSAPQIDQSGIAGSDSELGELLLTDFVLENEQFVPTSAWICADSIGQSRIYYFYPQGVLDASRSVAIERTSHCPVLVAYIDVSCVMSCSHCGWVHPSLRGWWLGGVERRGSAANTYRQRVDIVVAPVVSAPSQ